MADSQNQTFPLNNQGLQQKLDPAVLQQGQYSELTNIVSTQEGALSVRLGNERVTDASSTADHVSLIHSIGKLRTTDRDDLNHIYFGEGENIWRCDNEGTAPWPFSKVATGVANPASRFGKQRWTQTNYNAGAVGKPYAFFAGPTAMDKDDGTMANLQRWGILPPLQPVVASPADITIYTPGNPGIAVPGTPGAGPIVVRVQTNILSIDTTSDGASATFAKIHFDPTVGTAGSIVPGMMVSIGATISGTDLVGGRLAIVEIVGRDPVFDATNPDYFQAWLPTTPAVGDLVYATASEVGFLAGTGPAATYNFPLPQGVDASFDGKAEDGYDTTDVVHCAFQMDNPADFNDIRIRIWVNNPNPPSPPPVGYQWPDYYEKEIIPSTLSSYVTGTQTAIPALQGVTTNVDQAILGKFDITYNSAQRAKPIELNLQNPPVPPATLPAGTASPWTEIDIPKNEFVKVGNAGHGSTTWKFVTQAQIIFTLASGATNVTLFVGGIYIAGGHGPNSVSGTFTQTLFPYDYLYTFRNPVTMQESNPCVPMTAPKQISVSRQRIGVTMIGTNDPQIPIDGEGTIAVYRRGGNFADGLYRFLGYAANPGIGGVVTFLDDAADANIQNNRTIEFDNDAPVTSTLPTPVNALLTVFGAGAGKANILNTFTVNQSVASVTPGSLAVIAPNTPKEENVLIFSASGNTLTCWFQYDHSDWGMTPPGSTTPTPPTPFVLIDAVAGQPCYLSCLSGQSIYLAGDPNNPHVLYQSKPGRVEAFPIVELDTGISRTINVGSPSDPIMGITEFDSGELLCMNLSHLFLVRVWGGQMQPPIDTGATRGLISSFAWCRVDNAIWYLGYDGVYAWNGGQTVKVSIPIDWMFKGQVVGGIQPIDLTDPVIGGVQQSRLSAITFAYDLNYVKINYVDVTGANHRLRYDVNFNRWSIDDIYDAVPPLGTLAAVTAQFVEPDTGVMLFAKSVTDSFSVTWGFLYIDEQGTSDGWFSTEGLNGGASITFGWTTAGYMMGLPSLNKQYQDVIVETANDSEAFTIAAIYDFSGTQDATDTFPINGAAPSTGRHRIPLSLQNGFGKEAYACQFRVSGSSTFALTWYSLTFNFVPFDQIQVGRAYDWDDLGHPGDKRLFEFIVEYDPGAAQTVTINLDVLTGLPGAESIQQSVQTFQLTPVTGTFTGPSRARAIFPMHVDIIAKMVRVRPSVTTTPFKIWGKYSFIKLDYPPDIVPYTEWNDYGYAYDKYAQQVVLDVDTGGVAAMVQIFVDGNIVPAQTLTVNTTQGTRDINLTLKPNIKGKKFRMINLPGVGGKYQLFSENIVFMPADKGPVHHTYDYDELGWPYDKRLTTVTFRYDTNNTGPFIIQMDTINGISGGVTNLNVQQFQLAGPGRGLQTFPFRDGIVAKLVRFYPLDTDVIFKEWEYNLDFEKFPQDIVPFTPWSDEGWPCQKILREITLDVDTGGVEAVCEVQADGITMEALTVNSSLDNRGRMLSFHSNLEGLRFRLLNSPGPGGKFQLFSYKFNTVKEPCDLVRIDVYEQAVNWNGWSWIKQVWLEYICCVPIVVSLYVENDRFLYQTTLPAHIHRDVERFYVPAFAAGTPNVLNKARQHRMTINTIDDTSTFRAYMDASRWEVGRIGGDQRTAFMQFPLSEMIPIPIS